MMAGMDLMVAGIWWWPGSAGGRDLTLAGSGCGGILLWLALMVAGSDVCGDLMVAGV